MFNRAYTAASMCTPSRYAVLAGQFPGRCTANSFLEDNPVTGPYNIAWNTWITGDKITLARALGNAGFVTGMAGKWHVGWIPPGTELPEFHNSDLLTDSASDRKLMEQQQVYRRLVRTQGGFQEAHSVVWSNYDNHQVEALRFHNFPWMAKGAIEFLESRQGEEAPFFLYVATTAVHGPNHVSDLDRDVTFTPAGRDPSVLSYQLNVDSLGQILSGVKGGQRHRYAGMAQTDHVVGLIRKKLREIGEEDQTVIIFMADHNIEPGKATSFEKGIHVPLIIYWPGITSGETTDALVQNIDLYPTILEAAGIMAPENHILDGQSMMPVIRDPEGTGKEFIFAENGYTRAVLNERYKYIALRYPQTLVDRMISGTMDHVPSYVRAWPQAHSAIAMNCYPHYFDQDQLYDLQSDPYELENIYPSMEGSEVVEALKAALGSHLKSFGHPFSLDPVPFMQSDGYVELTRRNLAFDIYTIPWLNRDHGAIQWPPESH
jgi:arylsulfatase A-like enzyme